MVISSKAEQGLPYCYQQGHNPRDYRFVVETSFENPLRPFSDSFTTWRHVVQNGKVATFFSGTLLNIILETCFGHACCPSRGLCNGLAFSSAVGEAWTRMQISFRDYWNSEWSECHDSTANGTVNRCRGDVRQQLGNLGSMYSISAEFLEQMGGLILKPFNRAKAYESCSDPYLSINLLCNKLLRSSVRLMYHHMFKMHAAVLNLEGLQPYQALIALDDVRYDYTVPPCRGSCHATVAARALREPGRRREDGRVHAVEVGTYLGVTALRLLRDVPFLNLVMVDPFEDVKAYDDGAFPYKETETAYSQTHEALAPYRNRSVLIKQPSVIAGDLISELFFDVVIIDGDHSYEGCSADVATWVPKLRRGISAGVMVFHDYSIVFQGTVRCIHEAVERHALDKRLWLGPDWTAWFRVKDDAAL
eukprot:TRINITY_DN55462_c0_g1_i1.p1 TRINITY_DN55462_c0_g1~~TRINITY_DN55462_c0_g1_i1.p1  ORF type:complete len:419 (-),score=37.66 TRINITY_DN55462_c0_g1_i1:83-1339(-)